MAFSNITIGTSWQSLTIAKQIRVAYNKRRTACGMSTYANPNNTVTVHDFIWEMQKGIEEMCKSFADPEEELEGAISMPHNFSTVYEAMTRAELTQTGYWRRIPEGGSHPVATDYSSTSSYLDTGWSYGRIQIGDEAGIWLFLDIEKVLTSMTRIIRPYSVDGVQPQYSSAVGGINHGGLWAWFIHDDGPVTGSPSFSTPTDGNYATTSISVYKMDYSYDNPEDNPIDIIGASITLANYGLECGNEVTGTDRTVKFMAIPKGNHGFPATQLEVEMNVTNVTTEQDVEGNRFLKWYPTNPQGFSLSWLDLTDEMPDGDVIPDSYDNTKYFDIDYNDVASCTDYSFVDGATS